jgi:hypothetical protein
MIDDESPLSLEGIRTASAAGRLPDLARRLVAERRWSSIDVLLNTATATGLSLDESAIALVALCEALTALPPTDQKEAFAELHTAELRAARALVRRSEREPLTETDRAGLGAAAALCLIGGDATRAATLYEKAGDDERAAEIWGSLGELEKMEACLGRQERQQGQRRRLREARRQFETLFAAGDRAAAITLGLQLRNPVAEVHAGDSTLTGDAFALVQAAQRAHDRLCRGRAVTLRLGDGRLLRVAALPAGLGRDPETELPVRDPTVSRRHARLVDGGAGNVAIEDAGSRAGTRLAGFPIAGAIPLGAAGELALGATCRLQFELLAAGDELGARVVLRGEQGLDRGLWAVAGPGPVVIGDLIAAGAAAQVAIDFASGVARLQRPTGLSMRVDGHLIGPGCDLLRGDVIEAEAGTKAAPQRWRWEVL